MAEGYHRGPHGGYGYMGTSPIYCHRSCDHRKYRISSRKEKKKDVLEVEKIENS